MSLALQGLHLCRLPSRSALSLRGLWPRPWQEPPGQRCPCNDPQKPGYPMAAQEEGRSRPHTKDSTTPGQRTAARKQSMAGGQGVDRRRWTLTQQVLSWTERLTREPVSRPALRVPRAEIRILARPPFCGISLQIPAEEEHFQFAQ